MLRCGLQRSHNPLVSIMTDCAQIARNALRGAALQASERRATGAQRAFFASSAGIVRWNRLVVEPGKHLDPALLKGPVLQIVSGSIENDAGLQPAVGSNMEICQGGSTVK